MIDKLKEVIQKANPEIMELKFGCDVMAAKPSGLFQATIIEQIGLLFVVWFWDSEGDVKNFTKESLKILGRPIRLADVLIALSKKKRDYEIAITANMDVGDFLEIQSQLEDGEVTYLSANISWNLQKDNLDDQTKETKKFLTDLLIT